MALLRIPQHDDFNADEELMRLEHWVERELNVEHQDSNQYKEYKDGFIDYRNSNQNVEHSVSMKWEAYIGDWLIRKFKEEA